MLLMVCCVCLMVCCEEVDGLCEVGDVCVSV